MNDIRKRVSKFTLELQAQTDLPHWALANEDVIYYLSIDEKPKWGPKSRIIARLIIIFNFIYATDVLIFCVGLYRAILIWLHIKKNKFKSFDSFKYKKVFVGFGASSEEYLYAHYANQTCGRLLRINSGNYDNTHQLGSPGLLPIIFVLLKNAFGYTYKVKNSARDSIASNHLTFLTTCALNIGLYAFYRSYWRMAKSHGIEEVIFLAADISAFSCIDEGIKTNFHQHGLLALSILFPKFDSINVITSDEKEYLKKFLENVNLSKLNTEIKYVDDKKNNMIILSPNVSIHARLLEIEPVIKWIKQKEWKVIIRPTPHVTHTEINILQKKLAEAVFDDLTISLNDSIHKWQPKIILSWLSTGLATALDYGCLPISLCKQIDDAGWNMIYPLKHRVLFWPSDKSIIEAALQSQEIYIAQLNRLKNYNDVLNIA